MTSARSSGSSATSSRPMKRNEHVAATSARSETTSRRFARKESAAAAADMTSGPPEGLAVDQADFCRPRAFGRFLGRELDALALAEQLEDRAADGRAVEKMLDAAFVANEPEAFVNQESCNRAAGHD